MNRCSLSPSPHRRTALGAVGCLLLGLWASVQAQTVLRQLPPKSLRGEMVVLQPPVISLNGKTMQLSPGARIRGPNNMLLLSGSLIGKELTVNYLLEPQGMVHEVWILTDAEAAQKWRPTGGRDN